MSGEAAKQIELGGLPELAPEWASPGAKEVYAANRQYFVDLENTAGDLEMVLIWCEAVAAKNYASKKYWAAIAAEEEQDAKNGDVLASDRWWTKFRQACELVKKATQDLGAAQAVRRRLKQDMKLPAAKVLEKWDWFGEPAPNSPPADAVAEWEKRAK